MVNVRLDESTSADQPAERQKATTLCSSWTVRSQGSSTGIGSPVYEASAASHAR